MQEPPLPTRHIYIFAWSIIHEGPDFNALGFIVCVVIGAVFANLISLLECGSGMLQCIAGRHGGVLIG